MVPVNNIFNTPSRTRFQAPTCILQETGLLSRVAEFLEPGVPTYLVHDAFFSKEEIGVPVEASFAVLTETCERDVFQAIERCPAGRFQVLALGGGSTIDLAKALVAFQHFGVWKRVGYGDLRYLADGAPIRSERFVAVPSTAGTGSETSRYWLVKDDKTKRKVVSRCWGISPDVALLDPELLSSFKPADLIPFAFDAFTHAWETYFCAQESSKIIDLIAMDSMARIIRAVREIITSRGEKCTLLSELQMAAAQGGVCLSNVRTGFLHTAGEALSAQVPIPHPQSLWVFFRSLVDFYATQIRPKFESLVQQAAWRFGSPEEIVEFWQTGWDMVRGGTGSQVGEGLPAVSLSILMEDVSQDRVLLEKECPRTMVHEELGEILIKSCSSAGVILSTGV